MRLYFTPNLILLYFLTFLLSIYIYRLHTITQFIYVTDIINQITQLREWNLEAAVPSILLEFKETWRERGGSESVQE